MRSPRKKKRRREFEGRSEKDVNYSSIFDDTFSSEAPLQMAVSGIEGGLLDVSQWSHLLVFMPLDNILILNLGWTQ